MIPFHYSVSSKYGAPMGRRSDRLSEFGKNKLHLRKVSMVDGCYDKGGAYWGAGTQLWCVWGDDQANEIVNESYLRAHTREAAIAEIRKACPHAKFFR